MIGQNIYRLRTQSGITLTELAERAGISKSYLSSIERNVKQNPSIQVMEKIALVLDVDLKTLLKVDVVPEVKQQLEREWLELVRELQNAGFDKERMREYKLLIEFMRWYSDRA